MRKRKYILEEAGALLIVAALVISMAAATATTENEQPELTLTTEATQGIFQNIVWDNGMEYDGLGASQEDTQYPLSFMCADDFMFAAPTEVCDVHWVGGYWNDPTYNTVHWPWIITFYYDDGTGERPGQIYLGPFVFDDTQYTEVLIEDTGTSIYYEFSVDLLENYLFPPDEKFWIVIQGVGFFPPQSGWGLHEDPITLHEAVFKGELLGFPDWTDTFDVFGYSADMCFQLTTKEDAIPDLSCDGSLIWEGVGPGATVNGEFYVGNVGEVGSILNWKIDSYPTWGTWTFSSESGSLAEGDWETITVDVVAPPDENTEFTGTVKVINVDDPSDYCEISVILETPLNQNSMVLQILNNFIMQRLSI